MRGLFALGVLLWPLAAGAASFVFDDKQHVNLTGELIESLTVSNKAHIRLTDSTVMALTITDLGKVWLDSGNLLGPVVIEDKGKLFLGPGVTLDPNLMFRLEDKGKVQVTSVIPEPATAALMALGLLGLVGCGYASREELTRVEHALALERHERIHERVDCKQCHEPSALPQREELE